jgi:hypothetical protein
MYNIVFVVIWPVIAYETLSKTIYIIIYNIKTFGLKHLYNTIDRVDALSFGAWYGRLWQHDVLR